MTANATIVLPVPSANAAGAWVDASSQAPQKTVIVGGSLVGVVTFEVSNELTPTSGAPLCSFTNQGNAVVVAVARWMRVVVSGYKRGAAVATCEAMRAATVYATPVATAGDGDGAPVALDCGDTKTATVTGPFRGTAILEASQDGGTTWAQVMTFQSGGMQTRAFAAGLLRVVRSGVPDIAPGLPVVNVGGVDEGTAANFDLGWYNVKDYGAIGDGVHDDAPAIMATILAATAAAAYASGVVYFPNGTYLIGSTITYVGAGNALTLRGEMGGDVVNGTRVLWAGPADGTMFDISGVWRGTVEQIDFDGASIAQTCFWAHSDQPYGGVGWQGYVFSHCGFLFPNPASPDPVAMRVGDVTAPIWVALTAYAVDDLVQTGAAPNAMVYRCITAGVSAGAGGPAGLGNDIVDGTVHWAHMSSFSTYQCDTTNWYRCRFIGDYAIPETITLWRQEQGGNTVNFSFEGGAFAQARWGIDAELGSGTLLIEDVFFGKHSDGPLGDGTDAACMRFGESVRVEVLSCSTQNELKSRFIEAGAMGSGQFNGLIVDGCTMSMEDQGDLGFINYDAPMVIRNCFFGGAVTNVDTCQPRVIVGLNGPLFIGVLEPAGKVPGAYRSENNSYGNMPAGSYAPWYNGFGAPLIGPDSYNSVNQFYGFRRCPVYSYGDGAALLGDPTHSSFALEPWDGTVAHDILAWAPGVIAPGATVTVTRTWGGAAIPTPSGVLATCDEITVTFTDFLPAGCVLTAGKSAAEDVWASITNHGAAPTPALAGDLLWSARKTG